MPAYCFALPLMALSLACAARLEEYDVWKLVLLSDSTAKCLDGSSAGYYIKKGASHQILLHLQGGGWCTSVADCYNRSQTPLGSSKTYAAEKNQVLANDDGGAHGLLSSDPKVNPKFANWTKLYVRYCDGGSFSGKVSDPVSAPETASKIFFRGKQILDAVLKDVMNVGEGSGDAAGKELIVSGCSAGGLAVWLHLDFVGQGYHVAGIPESGLFMDLPTNAGINLWPKHFQNIAVMQNMTTSSDSNLNTRCLASQSPAQKWKCFLAQNSLVHTSTPVFPVQSVYDEWQTVNILNNSFNCLRVGRSGCTKGEAAALDGLRTSILGNLTAAIGPPNKWPPSTAAMAPASDVSPLSGFYLINCGTHCGFLNHDEGFTDFGDFPLGQAVTRWYEDTLDSSTPKKSVVRNAVCAFPTWGPGAYADCE